MTYFIVVFIDYIIIIIITIITKEWNWCGMRYVKKKCKRDYDVDSWKGNETCGSPTLKWRCYNGDTIKMDEKPIEWKGLISLGAGTDIALDRDKERGLAYAVRGVRLP